MPSTEEQIQKAVRSVDNGRMGRWIWRSAFITVAIALSVYYLMSDFRGLPIAQAMDQAQVGREILRGHGWQTEFVRPLAIGELRRHGKNPKTEVWYDTYNGPIPPLLDAAALYFPITQGWSLTITEYVYSGDRAIALMGILFFLAAVVVLYFIAQELFDRRLAVIAVGLVMICDMMWQYATSGLPQMELLFLLHLSVYAMLRAMRAQMEGTRVMPWLAAVAMGFGLMALTHALSIFIFVPVLFFAVFNFRRRGLVLAMMLAIFLVVYVPWLVRNAMVCGDFRGLAGFSGLDGITHSEPGHMRGFAINLGETSGNYYAQNFRLNLQGQINRLIELTGWSCVAPVALVSVLHAFRAPVTRAFRRLLFMMFAGAVCGMSVFGLKQEGALASNQFYMLFVPLFICYGMAFILVQWDRRIGMGANEEKLHVNRSVRYVLRNSLLLVVFLLSGIPMMSRIFLQRNTIAIVWPPYVPPYIHLMHDWFAPNELVASDIPWAVAWYADRKSIWFPINPKDLNDISDYEQLGGPISALYFTPVSGTQNTLGDLVSGDYKLWTGYIVRTIDLTKTQYPLRTVLGMAECTLYMDKDRRTPEQRK